MTTDQRGKIEGAIAWLGSPAQSRNEKADQTARDILLVFLAERELARMTAERQVSWSVPAIPSPLASHCICAINAGTVSVCPGCPVHDTEEWRRSRDQRQEEGWPNPIREISQENREW